MKAGAIAHPILQPESNTPIVEQGDSEEQPASATTQHQAEMEHLATIREAKNK